MEEINDLIAYDSTKDTLEHIGKVQNYLTKAANELIRRGEIHDKSKLVAPEKEHFDRETPLLKELKYGSEDYLASCKRLKEALTHHYENNSHHPQYYEDGVDDMDLFDLIEMFYDWKASGERTADGNIYTSIGINSPRFGISKQLRKILTNTADRYSFKNIEHDR